METVCCPTHCKYHERKYKCGGRESDSSRLAVGLEADLVTWAICVPAALTNDYRIHAYSVCMLKSAPQTSMTNCSGHLCGCTSCEIHHYACVRAGFFMCRFRPSLSVDVWAQWLVVFLSEAQLVLCVGHACKLNHAFIWNVRVQLNLLGTNSLLCFYTSWSHFDLRWLGTTSCRVIFEGTDGRMYNSKNPGYNVLASNCSSGSGTLNQCEQKP